MNEKILIIDDERMILDHLNMLLTYEGYLVRKASDGFEAMEILRAESPDLVITDIRMPGIDGLELTSRIREMNKETEIIILTGFVTSENKEKAMKGGASYFLGKPLNKLDDLLIPIEHCIEKRKRKRAFIQTFPFTDYWSMASFWWSAVAKFWLFSSGLWFFLPVNREVKSGIRISKSETNPKFGNSNV